MVKKARFRKLKAKEILACTPGQRPGLNTLDAGRRVGAGQGDREFRIMN